MSTFLTIAIAVITVALSGVGIEMVNNPPVSNGQKWAYRSIFIICGLLLVAATAVLSVHTDKLNSDAQEKASQSHVQDVGQMQYMKGKLDTIADVLSRFAANIQASAKPVPSRNGQPLTPSTAPSNPMSPANIASTLADVARQAGSNPSVENVRLVQRGFSRFAKTIDPNSACLVRITSPEDSRLMASDMAQLASTILSTVGSKCKVQGPSNLDVDPDAGNLALSGMIPGKVIFHVGRNQSGADPLFDDLSFNTPMQKSFDIPQDVPPNYVWLQFGTGMHWRN